MINQDRPNFMLFALWRLLAALLVMLYHLSKYGPDAWVRFSFDMEVLGPLLDMFFIISGFLIWVHYSPRLNSAADYRSFLLRRFARLYPLHLLTLACFCLVWLGVSIAGISANMTAHYTWPELLRHLLLVNAWGGSEVLTFNYVSWSVSAEWFCYLLFPILLLAFRKFGTTGLLGLLALTIIGLEMLVAFEIMPFESWMAANTWGAYRVFADFVLGAIIAEFAMRRPLPIKSHLFAWAALGGALVVMLSGPATPYLSMVAIALALSLRRRWKSTRLKSRPI